ncbi:MAG TPA: FIST N-terminal domain-containing protein [Candidatus Dormibacteraeota bacterium]|nr:FIST N-terminal domain-containing protein [Candidatus Dormibacteraeota bacterium]
MTGFSSTTVASDPDQSDATAARWVGAGASRLADSRRAGAEAATAAVRGTDTRLLVVFASQAHDLAALLNGIRDVCPDAPLIGCSTAGEIAADGPGESSVVVTALGGDGFSVATAMASGAAGDLRQAGATVGACIEQVEARAHQVLLLLTDGLAGDQQEIVRGAYGVVGAAVPLVGGCAGDDLRMTYTQQLFGDAVVDDSVVAAAISSDAPIGIGVRHGWRRVGDPMLVTCSEGNRVLALDDQPALDVYLDRLDAPAEARTDSAAFTRFAMTHPLGLSRRSGEEVRFVAEAGFADRSIGCIAEVPQGGLAWMMEGDAASVLGATDAACSDALTGLEGNPPIGLIAFDCIARRGVLGSGGVEDEVSRIGLHADGAPVSGFYTYGEIARTRGISGFHNQTLVVLALS